MRTGIFVGSFDPFTIGHDSIVRRALPLFDRLVIGVVGDNVNKKYMSPAEVRMETIRNLYSENESIEVRPYFGQTLEMYAFFIIAFFSTSQLHFNTLHLKVDRKSVV